MTIRARQFVLLAAAAAAVPLLLAVTSSNTSTVAGPACLARVTSQGDDPVCVGTSNGQPIAVGSPDFGVYGPGGTGGGVRSGTLLPGQTWNAPIG